MDTLTHALSGALVGRAAAPRDASAVSARDCVALGFLAAAFPDTDAILTLWSPLAYLYHHRGATHSLLLLPLWALSIGWLWSRLRRNRSGFRTYTLVTGLAIFAHILGDLITSFGTMIFAPLSDARIELGTTFIIDLWFSGIIIAGLLAAWALQRSRVPAVLGLAVLAGYVGFQWVQLQRAERFGHEYAAALGLNGAQVKALPRPVSPFNWMVVVIGPEHYHYATVNLVRREPRVVAPEDGWVARLDAPYLPLAQARWVSMPRFGEGDRALVDEAWAHPEFAFFRWFASLPLVDRIEQVNPSTCVWFRDLRFYAPGRDAWPFRYGMCRENGGGSWRAYQGGEGEIPRRL